MANTIRVKQFSVTVNNGASATVDALVTVASTKQNVVAITCDELANVDLLVYSGQILVVDIPTDQLPQNDKWLQLPLDVDADGKITVGFRNNSGGAVTKVITLRYTYGS